MRSCSAPTSRTEPKHHSPSETTVAVGADRARCKACHLLVRERLLAQAHKLRLARGRGLHRGNERHLVLRAAPGPAARALAAQVGIVKLDPAIEHPGVLAKRA